MIHPVPGRALRMGRLLLTTGCVLLLLVLAVGAAYEQSARKLAAARFPPPGKMIDIGGRRIHLDCSGDGAPTVVLEAGLDPLASRTWSQVREPVAAFTRVCAYDRAGLMWSDPASAPRSGLEIAADLDHTLAAAGVEGPYVLVGHSMGGPYALLFAKRVGKQVAGLVLLDATHPRQQSRLAAIFERPWYERALMHMFMRAAWTGLPRLLSSAGEADAAASVAFEPRSMAAAADELEAIDTTLNEADAAHTLGALPLVVMTALAPRSQKSLRASGMSVEQDAAWRAAWLDLQRDEATWSSASRHIVFEDSGHSIQTTKPQAVVAAIQHMVEQLRSAD